jgi:4-amino-4-deoxychorismate lyase
MCLLLETIKINNGFAENIFWHNKRFNAARRQLFNIDKSTELENLIVVPDEYSTGLVKCRIGYEKEIEFIQFEHYIFREVRSLKIVTDPSIQYDYKYSDRTRINELFARREDKDDILIVKNDLVCESSYSNVVFSDGTDYYTPASSLLKGTKRSKYLAEGRIAEREITVNDISMFQEVHLINAFLDLGKCVILTTDIN